MGTMNILPDSTVQVANQRLYMLGGVETSSSGGMGALSQSVKLYSDGGWVSQPSLNHGRFGPFAQLVTIHGLDHILAVGGNVIGGLYDDEATVEIWDGMGQWRLLRELSFSGGSLKPNIVVFHNYIYRLGDNMVASPTQIGPSNCINCTLSDVFVTDLQDDINSLRSTWQHLDLKELNTDLKSTNLKSTASVIWQNSIYYFIPDAPVIRISLRDMKSHTTSLSLPYKRMFQFRVLSCLDTICIIGGATDIDSQHAKEINKLSGQSWVKLSDKLSKVTVNPAVTIGNIVGFRTTTTTTATLTTKTSTMDINRVGNLFVCGGKDKEGRDVNHVQILDPYTDSWTVVKTNRAHHDSAAVIYEGQLVVLGGMLAGESEISKMVSVFENSDFNNDKIPPMNKGRRGNFAAVWNDVIFAVGGEYSDSQYLGKSVGASTVEFYDSLKGKWLFIEALSFDPKHGSSYKPNVLVHENFIYRLGDNDIGLYSGYTDNYDIFKAFRFDTKTMQGWDFVAQTYRTQTTSAVFQNKIASIIPNSGNDLLYLDLQNDRFFTRGFNNSLQRFTLVPFKRALYLIGGLELSSFGPDYAQDRSVKLITFDSWDSAPKITKAVHNLPVGVFAASAVSGLTDGFSTIHVSTRTMQHETSDLTTTDHTTPTRQTANPTSQETTMSDLSASTNTESYPSSVDAITTQQGIESTVTAKLEETIENSWMKTNGVYLGIGLSLLTVCISVYAIWRRRRTRASIAGYPVYGDDDDQLLNLVLRSDEDDYL
eukprot:m.316374 g.316374  ORF g.316374 m.316374 type:complete len:765 (-) comp16503_c0_seq2:256-2550(-)